MKRWEQKVNEALQSGRATFEAETEKAKGTDRAPAADRRLRIWDRMIQQNSERRQDV